LDLELGFKENQEESITGDGVGRGHEEEGQDFAFHFKPLRLKIAHTSAKAFV
jgi:hypothetical protein